MPYPWYVASKAASLKTGLAQIAVTPSRRKYPSFDLRPFKVRPASLPPLSIHCQYGTATLAARTAGFSAQKTRFTVEYFNMVYFGEEVSVLVATFWLFIV